MSENAKFHYHQGLAPMVWVLFVLSLIELVVVHIFVALMWPILAWILTTLSAFGAIWLAWWIFSFKRLPHQISDQGLTLHLGTLLKLDLEFENIAGIKSSFDPGALDKKGIMNLAFIAHPNRCFELKQPIKKNKDRIYVRLDDSASFDKALAERGFVVV